MKSFASEEMKVTDFSPFIKMKNEIAVKANPPNIAPKNLYLFSIWKVNNNLEMYYTIAPKTKDKATDNRILYTISAAFFVFI